MMDAAPSPSLLVTKKVIAHRARVGVKKLEELATRADNDNPFPLDWDELLGYVAEEQRIAAWEEAELKRRIPYKKAIAEGRTRTRKAS